MRRQFDDQVTEPVTQLADHREDEGQADRLIQQALAVVRSRFERGEALQSPRDAARYVQLWLGPRQQEVFACLFLDNRHRIIASEVLFHGTVDSAAIYPREVVRRTIDHNAAAVICAHNHPSGSPEPSRADEIITRRLQEALSLVDVRLLDHLVVGETVTSLAERGCT
ncbi:DNA repair protein RadC [Aquisalimonas asiatica]|uniref:DNA repair protein RadC n=1 Tax=Aquisalimonas asiatica TaxID=406100 RepID=A0A1H8VRY0_9GAMM|nr:DNA repair protein RadC [Aquisalimonas asiatica]